MLGTYTERGAETAIGTDAVEAVSPGPLDWHRAVVREIAEIHSHNAIPRRCLPELLTRLRTALGVSADP
jgi:hypothetical protein